MSYVFIHVIRSNFGSSVIILNVASHALSSSRGVQEAMDGEDDSFCGDADGSVVSHRPRRRLAPTSAAAEESELCYLCETPLGFYQHKYKGLDFDAGCFAAVRCRRRLIMGNSAGLKAEDELMITDPESWRPSVLPLVKDSKHQSRTLARGCAKRDLQESVETSGQKNIEDTLLLTKRRFKSYHSFWDGISSADASERFDDDLSEADCSCRNSDDEPRVQVRDNIKQRASAGQKRVRRRVAPESGRGRSPLGGPTEPRRTRDRERGRERDRQRPGGPNRTRDSRGGRADEQRSARGLKREAGAQAKSSVDRLTHRRLAEHTSVADDARSLAGGASASSGLGVAIKQEPGRGHDGKLTMPEVMKIKACLKKEVQAALAAATSARSVQKQIKSKVERLSPEQLNTLENPPSEAMDAIEKHRLALAKHQEHIEGAKGSTIEGIRDTATTLMESLSNAEVAAQETLDAVCMVTASASVAKRMTTNAERYAKNKIIGKMVAGGVGKGCAKLCAGQIREPECEARILTNPAMKDIDFDRVCKWSSGDKEGEPVAQAIREVLSGCSLDVDAKTTSLFKSLADHERWQGALCKLDLGSSSLSLPGAKVNPMFINEVGACQWLTGFKPHRWRFGPSAWPLPGVGTFVVPLTSHVILNLFEVGPLVGAGISLTDLMSHLDTNTGEKYFADHAIVLPVTDTDVVWVPWGWMVAPMAVPEEELKKTQTELDHYGACWTLPLFDAELQKKIPNNAWLAMKTMNDEWLEKTNSSGMWQARAALWKTFTNDLVVV